MSNVYSQLPEWLIPGVHRDTNLFPPPTMDALAEALGGGGGYEPPEGGIPETDLSPDVQASLSKADSALQAIPSTVATKGDVSEAVSAVTPASIGAQPAGNYASAADLDNVFGIANAAIPATQKAAANGVATLDVDGKVPSTQLRAASKGDVGLGNVDNTADADKPLSIAAADALAGKAASSHTHPAAQISDSSVIGRSVLTAADAPAVRTALGLSSVGVMPETYGAVGDGVTDDTVAIRNAFNAAYSFAVSTGTFYAQVVLGDRTYLCDEALVQGGATKGNSILPLPVVAATAQKVTFEIKGFGSASALPHWSQTVAQRAGTVIKTTKTSLAYSSTYGNPSIIGGPSAEQMDYGVGKPNFSNMLIVIDGVQLQAPKNPSMHGFDFGCVAEAIVRDAGCQANQTPATAAASDQYKSGLVMPYAGNNAVADIVSYSVEGWHRGALVGEHANIYSYRAVYCNAGIALMYPAPHSGIAVYACIEGSFESTVELVGVTAAWGDTQCFFDFLCLDIEAGAVINDSANHWYGEVFYNNNGVGTLALNGAANMRFVNRTARVGLVTDGPPAVPATTVALRNPFNRDANVIVTGGSVSDILIDGQSTGLTSGMLRVDSGHSIAIAWTVKPTWKWLLT